MTSVRGRYFAWVRDHAEWAEVPLEAFTDIWRYAAGTTLRAQAQFSDQLRLMRELIWYLEAGAVEDEAEAWAESNANAEEHAIRAMDEPELEELPF